MIKRYKHKYQSYYTTGGQPVLFDNEFEYVMPEDAEALERRIAELEMAIRGLESERRKLIDIFKICRDATGYSDEYSRAMYNGIEWARSCLEKDEPRYKNVTDKLKPLLPTIVEELEAE